MQRHTYRAENASHPALRTAGQVSARPLAGLKSRPVASLLRGEAHIIRLPLCCQACRFSPFRTDLLAVATAELFGIAGGGSLHVLSIFDDTLSPAREGRLQQEPPWRRVPSSGENIPQIPLATHCALTTLNTGDSITDCAWSESNEHVIAVACGDGVTRLWDFRAGVQDTTSVRGAYAGHGDAGAKIAVELRGHTAEVCGVDWSTLDRNLLVSSSWDGTAIAWDVSHHSGVYTLVHPQCVYAASFSPLRSNVVGSVSADGHLRIFDLRLARGSTLPSRASGALTGKQQRTPVCDLEAHGGCEALCLDWSKYHEHEIFTGGADGCIRLWDTRFMNRGPLMSVAGLHRLAVRNLKCSPFSGSILATASYDTSVKILSISRAHSAKVVVQDGDAADAAHEPSWELFTIAKLMNFDHHTEFVMGIDWSLFYPHLIASASWDRHVYIWPPFGREIRHPP